MRGPLLRLKLLLLVSLLMFGCGKANDSSVTVNASGSHPSGWMISHGPAYLRNINDCTPCHGSGLNGGISGVSCSSSSFEGLSCHANGPHIIPWPAHNQTSDQLNSCSPCHGAGLSGGLYAPACSQCHTQLPPGTAPVLGTCISCHGTPPNGAVFPNISAAHLVHSLNNLPDSCDTCHLGGGTGTLTHGTTPTVAFLPVYDAKNAKAIYNATGSCSNVSCHGGLTTPLWRGGRINPLAECSPCHQSGPAPGLPQANSYYSGEHALHLVSIGLICTDCHDMSVVSGTASHFSGLNTPTFELDPASTMRAPLNFNNVDTSCTPGATPPTGSFSIGVCHATRSW